MAFGQRSGQCFDCQKDGAKQKVMQCCNYTSEVAKGVGKRERMTLFEHHSIICIMHRNFQLSMGYVDQVAISKIVAVDSFQYL